MNSLFIYQAVENTKLRDSSTAIIVMPDIFGITDYAMATMQEFAKVLQKPVYMFDYFYTLTSTQTTFSAEQSDKAFALMQKMRGEDFVPFFKEAISIIQTDNPNIKECIVIGFCFAGRLAYLTGIEKSVIQIVSFYGAGAHTPDYYQGKTPIEALMIARQNDPSMKVLSFYGTEDESIPKEDRERTKRELESAGITYNSKEYAAKHAYFQPGRPNYNEAAAQASWQDLKDFLN